MLYEVCQRQGNPAPSRLTGQRERATRLNRVLQCRNDFNSGGKIRLTPFQPSAAGRGRAAKYLRIAPLGPAPPREFHRLGQGGMADGAMIRARRGDRLHKLPPITIKGPLECHSMCFNGEL